MIMRNMKTVKLLEVVKKQLDFGEEIIEKYTDLQMAMFEKSVANYSLNSIDGVKYDYIGLTNFSDIKKGMYILNNDIKYKVNFVQNSKRYKTVYLERVV